MTRNNALFILIVVIILLAIYWNSFGYEMIWDSKLLFENNILFEQNKPLSSAFKIGYFREQMGVGNIDFYYRPLLTASFVLEHKTWGIRASTLRITNLMIFILSPLLGTVRVFCTYWAGYIEKTEGNRRKADQSLPPGRVGKETFAWEISGRSLSGQHRVFPCHRCSCEISAKPLWSPIQSILSLGRPPR